MFATLLTTETLEKKRYELGITQSSYFYRALKDGLYKIFYSYNEIDEVINYEALLKKENDTLPDYISVSIDPSCSINENSTFLLSHQKELCFYILERDFILFNNDRNKLLNIYLPIYTQLQPLLVCDINNLLTRINSRKIISNFIEELLLEENNNIYRKTNPVRIEYYFENVSSKWLLSLKIGYEKMYFVQNFNDFLFNISNENEYSYGKGLSFKHNLDAFTKTDQEAISIMNRYFKSNINDYYRSKYMDVYDDIFVMLLSCLKDRYVFINDDSYYIDPIEIECEITVNSEGKISYAPDYDFTSCIFHKQKGINIDNHSQIINIISFKNSIQQKIYSFLLKNKEIDFSSSGNIFISKLLPLIEGNVNVAPDFKQRVSKFGLNIVIYFDITNKDELVIKTDYLLNEAKKEKRDLMHDSIYRNKILRFENELEKLKISDNEVIINEERVGDFLRNDLSSLSKVASVMLSESLKQKSVITLPKIRINASYDMDWLSLEVTSDTLDSKQIYEILSAYKNKKKYYKYNDSFILLDDSINKLSSLEDEFSISLKENYHHIPLYNLLKLNLLDVDYSINQKAIDILSSIKNYKSLQLNLSSIQRSSLRSYQIDAVKWLLTLHKNNLSGILADDMGLGKTLEMITFISLLNEERPILIISPKSLLYNWSLEFDKWAPSINKTIIDGDKEYRSTIISNINTNQKDIFITSYDSLKNDLELYDNINFSLIILDEAQYIKNAYTQKSKAVKALKADNRFAMTGTPIENSLSDLWSIFDFLMPGYLYSYQKFNQKFLTLINNDGNKEASLLLQKKVSPFILKRKKEDVLNDLPPKETFILPLQLNTEQELIYKSYFSKAKLKIKNTLEIDKISLLATLTRLRQICVDPGMFLENYTEFPEKYNFCLETIKNAILSNHKVLVFSSFKKSLSNFLQILNENKIPSLYIHGDVSAKKRIEEANLFNTDDKYKVMLVSLKAGGTGLNLTGADIVIHLDPWWNLAAENQATDRAHRLGQNKPVTVLKLIAKDTIEEKVIRLQEIKKNLASDYVPDDDSSLITLNEDDISFLLS